MNFSELFTQHEKADPPIRFGIFGDPIAHSLSPLFQNAALLKAGLEYRYAAFHVTPQELPEALAALRQSSFLGLNLTIPHKQRALSLVDEVTTHAQNLGSINTIVVRDQKLYGHNTDGPGVVAALREQWDESVLKGKRVLILGANGGTGRAIAAQCALEGCSALYLASRNWGQSLITSFGRQSIPIKFLTFQEEALAEVMPHVDLIVNATPLGMKKNDPLLIPSSYFHPEQLLYDIVYTPTRTPLMEAASQAGARASNGLLMLLHQGALAFELWFDQPAPLAAMRKALFASQVESHS